MWGLFSKDPTKDFPFDSVEQVGQLHLANKSVWTLHKGKNRATQEPVSIFSCDAKDGASATQLDVARAAVKRLKTLRHPSVLTFVQSVETEKVVLLATEPVSPLAEHLELLVDRGPKRDNYLAWGIFQVCRALSFLNNDAKLKHNNIHSASVFVTDAGDWKLAGLESVCPSDAEPPLQILPNCEKYSPPERKDPAKARLASVWAADTWGLGCLIWEVYNGALPAMENLGKLGEIPKSLQPTYKECVGAKAEKRPNPSEIITKLKKSPGFFKNDVIDIVLFLEELQIKEDSDKSRFYSSLAGLLDNCPRNVCQNKILPQLINAFEYGNAGSAILTPVFKIGKDLDSSEFQTKIVPCIVKLFSSNDRNARFKLLSQVEHFVEHLSKTIVNDQVFPKIESGFLDSEPLIREKTVISMIHLSPKLTYANLDETVVLKHFTRLARDEQGGIRTNTTVCLGKIARYLHPKTRQQVLLACFTRGLKDPFPPSRIAAINAIAATQHFYTVAETGCRVLPVLGASTVDPEKPVREQALRVIRGFLGKLEKVSEDPTLKEEMEKDVGSTNSAMVQAASGWASWAVGAVTAKFYKSPTAPASNESTPAPEESDVKEKTPDRSRSSVSPEKEITSGVNKMEMNNSYSSSGKKSTPAKSEAGWDIQEDDGWGEIKDDQNEEGWDDDDDWGSLEEKAAPTKIETPSQPSASSNDWGGGFNQGVKTHGAFADIKDTSANNSGSGWGEWDGDSAESKDEARKRREEKKAERQKEIEAKRAAKKGPLKLGGKKNMD
eukprot:TRINITY_DN11500_c0_g1_i1.p1 TRINITY_DN11500_c0_g1~~TRINITY_DN11500_c0_g1_i1.p1  ORF type:complete len:779 (-),score=257.03 TRINITY_DN11500_c0_g1_i1:196-2532(-)